MSATDRPGETPARVASACRDAGFVRLVGTADGDALAAAGLLARALGAAKVPYQVSLAAVPETPATDADCTIAIGWRDGDVGLHSEPLSVAAHAAARSIAPEVADVTLALAGAICTGRSPSGELLEAADLERRPGVALPTDDPVAGLAASTLVHTDVSGSETATASLLEELDLADGGDDPDAGRRLASWVALSTIEDAPPRATEAVQLALRPYVSDRFETLGGYADVLDAVARDSPGTGIALALGNDVEDAALEVWKAHGRRAHVALDGANTARYDGLFVASLEADAPLGTVARLCLEYRSPEPVALAVRDGKAAVEANRPIEEPLRQAATALDGRATIRDGRGRARFDGSSTDFVSAFREVL